jgi:hypothetical protein
MQTFAAGQDMKSFILHFTIVTLAMSAFAAEPPPVKVTFVRFGSAIYNGQCAILNLTNTSDKPFYFFTDSCIPNFDCGGIGSGSWMGRGCFLSQSPTGQIVWRQPVVGPTQVWELLPGKSTNIAVLLPQDGRIGRVGVPYKVDPSPPDRNWPWVECDQPIQCADDTPPRVKSVPPRVLLSREN